MNVPIVYPEYLESLAKKYSGRGAGGVVVTDYHINSGLSLGVSDDYYDFTNIGLAGFPPFGGPPAQDDIKSFVYGNLYVRALVVNANANGAYGVSFYDPTPSGMGGIYPIHGALIAAGVPDVFATSAPQFYLGMSFAYLRMTVTGAANSVTLYFKFDGVKVTWGS